jgi:hypothetical protein
MIAYVAGGAWVLFIALVIFFGRAHQRTEEARRRQYLREAKSPSW